MSDLYWSMNCLAIVSELQTVVPYDKNVKPEPNSTPLVFTMSVLPLLNAVHRFVFFVLPFVPGDGVAFYTMTSLWFGLCFVHACISTTRAYRYACWTTPRYTYSLWLAHSMHIKSNGKKWAQSALLRTGSTCSPWAPPSC